MTEAPEAEMEEKKRLFDEAYMAEKTQFEEKEKEEIIVYKKEVQKKMEKSLDQTREFSQSFKTSMMSSKVAMEQKKEASETYRKEKLEKVNPNDDYDFSEGYCRREGDAKRHDHRSRSINTQDKTACQLNCDANKDCVAFEMAPRCWWYSRDTDLAGSGRAGKECWVKRPGPVLPEDKVELQEPIVSTYYDEAHHPRNAIDGNLDTPFVSKQGT